MLSLCRVYVGIDITSVRSRCVALLALGGWRAGLVFFAFPVVDGCGLGGDVCCADCMCIRCAWT